MTVTGQALTSPGNVDLDEPSEAAAILSDNHAGSTSTFQTILAQLKSQGIRCSAVCDSQEDNTEPRIAIHPVGVGTLHDICDNLKQVKATRTLGISNEVQAIVENGKGSKHRYSTIRFIAAPTCKTVKRDPQSGIKNALRRARAWLHPNGLFCIVLGPDGVGKSTTIQRLQSELQTLLGPCTKQRWRPGVIRKVAPETSNRMPHAKLQRGSIASMLSLLGLALDFSIGYVALAYPAMVRSETFIFDRYFHDLLIDPKRYRYAGPMWLPRYVSRFVPPRKAIFIILDADEEVILRRKQELPLHELKRQRKAYRSFSSRMLNSMVVSTDRAVDEIVSEIMDKIVGTLSTRGSFRAASLQD